GEVLAVEDAEVRAQLVLERRQAFLDRTSAGNADDVGNEKDLHVPLIFVLFGLGQRQCGGRAQLDRDVIPRILGVLRERLLLDAREVDDATDLRRRRGDRRTDAQRRVRRQVRQRHDE